jgi:hypothetical protein
LALQPNQTCQFCGQSEHIIPAVNANRSTCCQIKRVSPTLTSPQWKLSPSYSAHVFPPFFRHLLYFHFFCGQVITAIYTEQLYLHCRVFSGKDSRQSYMGIYMYVIPFQKLIIIFVIMGALFCGVSSMFHSAIQLHKPTDMP